MIIFLGQVNILSSKMKIEFDTHGGNIEKEAKKLGLSIEKMIDASASLVPYKLPKKLIKGLD